MAAVFATGTAVMDAAPVATAGAAATAGIYAAVASVNTAAALVVTAAAAAGVTVTASAAASAVTAENMAVCPALTVSALAAEKAQETHTAASHPIFPCKQRPRLPQSQTNETLQQQSQQKTQQQQQQHFRTPQCTPVLPCVSLRWPRSSHELELLADLQSPNVAPPPQPLLQQQAQQHKRRAHSNQEQGHRQQTKHKRQKSPDSCEAAGEASPTARRVGHSAVTSMLSDGKQLQLSLTGVVFYSGSESSALRAAADIAARTSLPEATLLHQQLEQAGLTADAAPGEQTCRATVQRPGQRPQAQQRGRHEQQGATRTQHSQEYLAQLRPPRMLLQEDGRHQQGGQPQDRRWQQPLNLQTAPPHREALKQMARWWSSAACCGAWGPGVWGATCELLSRPPRRWERSSSSCSGSSTSQSTRSPVVRSSTSAASTCETHTRGTSAADETTSTPTRGAAAAGLASATAGPPPYTATRTWRHRVVPAWAGAISHPVRFPSYPPPRWRIQNLPSNDNVRRSSNSQSERTGGSALAHRSGDVCGCQGEPVVPESVGDSGSSWRSAARRWESISSTKKNATASQSSCLSSRYPLRPRDVYDQAHLHTRSVIMALGEGSWSSSHAGGVVRMQEARSTGDAVDEGDLQQTKSGSSSSWPELDRCGESWRMTQQQKGAALDRLLKAFRFRRLKRQGPGFESWGVNKEAAARSVDSGRPRARRVVAVVARVLVLLAVLLWEDAGSTRRRDTPPAAADAPAGRAATAGTAASRGGRDILRVACRAEMTGFGASGAVSYAPLTNNCRETALHSRTASDPGLHMCRGRQQQQLPVPADFRHARGRKAKCADEGYDWLVSCTSSSSPSIRSHLWRGEPEQAGHHVRNGLNGREVRSDSGVSSSTRRKRSHGNGNFIGDRRTDYSSNSCSKSMPSIRRATVASGLVFASAEPVAAAASPSEQGSNPAAEAGAAPTATTEWEDTFVTAMMLVEKEDNHEAAFPLFADCSMSDDVRCQYELGVYYFLGLPPLPARNFTAAMLLWHVSAWGGSAEAQYALSLMHANLRDLPVLPAFPPQTWGAGAAVAAAGSPPAARASTTAKSAAAAEREPAECAAAEGKIEAAAGGAASKMRPLQEKEGPRLWPLVQVRESDFAVLLLDREGTTDWAPLTSFTEQLQQQAYDEQQQIRFFRWLRSSSLFRAFGRLRETLSGWWDPLFGSSSNGSNRTVSTNTGRRTTDKARKKARKQKRHPKKPSGGKNDEVVMNSTMRAAVDAGLAGAPSPRPSGAAAAGSSPSPSSRQQRKRSAASAARRTAAAESTSSAAPARVSSVPNFASSSGVPMVLLYAAAAAGHPGAMMAMAQRLQSSSLDAPLRQQQACTGATNFLLPLARQVATTYASGIPQAPELLRFHSPMMSVNSKGQQHNDALLLFVPQPTAGAASADWFGSRSGGAGSNGGTSAGGNGDSTPSGLVDRLSPSSRELDMLTAVAQEGNTAVQLALGKRYLFGVEGLPQDFRLAQEFLLAAAEGGRSEARALLGYMYSLGVGVPRNTTSATFWFLSAVEAADHPVAYSGLGYLHFFGTDLIERNEEVALHFFNVSATHGFPDAQTNLASMYISGHGHSQSFVQAMQWYTRALQSGSTGAAYALGLMHLNGLGAVRDCALASSLLKRLVERSGYVTIKLQRVYDLYAQGRYDEAAFLLLLLAEAGLEVAQSDLAYLFDSGLTDLFFDGTIEKQRVHAQRYYEMATHQGSPLAGLRLGDFAYHGYGMQRLILPNRRQGCRYVDDEGNDMTEWVKEAIPVYTPRKVNYSAAVAHYRKVAEMSTSHKWMAAYAARGSFNLGFMHMYGLGVKQDFALARLYFGKCLEADPSSPRAPVYVALALLLLLRYKHEADIQRVVKQLYADVRVSLLVVLLLLLVVLLVIRRLTQILLQQVALNEAFEQLQMTRLQEQRQRQQQQRQQQPQQSQPQQSQPQQSQPQQSQPQQSQPQQPQPQQSQPQQSQPQQSQPQQSQPQQSQPQQLQTQQSQTQESQPQQSQPQQPQQQQDREEE